MKIAVGIALFFWLLCGLIGDWMLERDEGLHLQKIARGPITLVQAFQEKPVTIKGP